MSADPVLLLAAGTALGALAAQLAGPVAWNWPAKKGALKRRLLSLSGKRPGRGLVLAGSALIAAILGAGTLVAYAAQPAAPQRLPSQVVGVTGSGDDLALQLKTADGTRSLKVGEAYEDGWVVQGITPSVATLAKDGETQKVGLNPAGALAAAPSKDAASVVQLAGQDDAALLARAIGRGVWDGKTPKAGLTLAETQRYYILNEKFEVRWDAWQSDVEARAAKAGLGKPIVPMLENDALAILGPDALEYAQMVNKTWVDLNRRQAATYQQYGPVVVHVPAGVQQWSVTNPYGDARWSAPANRQPDGSYDVTMSNAPLDMISLDIAANPPAQSKVVLYAPPGQIAGTIGVTLTPGPPPP